MSGLCLATGTLVAFLPLQDFTLAWTHSIEKVRWEEDWRIEAAHLHLIEARVRGSGAGMEPPTGALLKAGVWHYRPELAPLTQLWLAHSGFTTGYELCGDGYCHLLAQVVGAPQNDPIELYACERNSHSD